MVFPTEDGTVHSEKNYNDEPELLADYLETTLTLLELPRRAIVEFFAQGFHLGPITEDKFHRMMAWSHKYDVELPDSLTDEERNEMLFENEEYIRAIIKFNLGLPEQAIDELIVLGSNPFPMTVNKFLAIVDCANKWAVKELSESLEQSIAKEREVAQNVANISAECSLAKDLIKKMEAMLRDYQAGALQSAKRPLKFIATKKLSNPINCTQFENGTLLYYGNKKPFELFTKIDENYDRADLTLLEGESSFLFSGVIGNRAYFRTISGKVVKFFQATLEDGKIKFDQISEINASDVFLFDNQPLYFVELSRKLSIYQYHENHTEKEGEMFDISNINHLGKYKKQYHRGILYLFREQSTVLVEKVNEKVVRVEGPLLDSDATSFYTPPHSEFIYILNSDENVLLILNTANLTVAQLCYEAPSYSNNHSIVGIHDRIITIAFDSGWGRHLATAKMPGNP